MSRLISLPHERAIVGADAVRAVACLWVFAGHVRLLSPDFAWGPGPVSRILESGGMGVAAFFVLSGFLLSMPFWRGLDRGAMPSLKTYAIRRLGRIVPEFFACVVILGVITGAMAGKWGLIQVAACLSFTSPLMPATYTPRFNEPLWSIGIEMHFYVLLAAVVWVMFRIGSRAAARCLIVALMVGIAAAQAGFLRIAPAIEQVIGDPSLFSAASSATTKNPLVLFAHFLVGVLAADVYLALPGSMKVHRFNRYDLVTASAIALLVIWVAGGADALPALAYMNYGWPSFSVLVATVLVGAPLSAKLGPVLDRPFICTTATLSYGIYMWHWPILRWLNHLRPNGTQVQPISLLLCAALALAGSYLAAALSYYLIGRPVLVWIRGRQRPVGLPPARSRVAA